VDTLFQGTDLKKQGAATITESIACFQQGDSKEGYICLARLQILLSFFSLSSGTLAVPPVLLDTGDNVLSDPSTFQEGSAFNLFLSDFSGGHGKEGDAHSHHINWRKINSALHSTRQTYNKSSVCCVESLPQIIRNLFPVSSEHPLLYLSLLGISHFPSCILTKKILVKLRAMLYLIIQI
jgi:hypothetical protein